MATRDLAIEMVFLSQTVVGVLGNVSLLYQYLFLYCTTSRYKSLDVILMHLNVANTLVLLSKGIPETMAAWGLRELHSDIGCKLLFYLHKLGRDVSIGTTCLLSVFQAITISPRDSRWAELKVRVPRYKGTFLTICWVLNMMLSILVPVHVTGRESSRNNTNRRDYGHCSAVFQDKVPGTVYLLLALVRDVFCVGLMLWASGTVVFILYRHKQRMQHVLRSNVSPRSSPESRATQGILALVGAFVSLSTLSSALHIPLAFVKNSILWLVNTSTLIARCFPAVSPYILMSYDSRVCRIQCVHPRKMTTPKSGGAEWMVFTALTGILAEKGCPSEKIVEETLWIVPSRWETTRRGEILGLAMGLLSFLIKRGRSSLSSRGLWKHAWDLLHPDTLL
ncbi:vomeronasal type-1 receptor 4-like [Marmota flaviventris]|uniref:vomeronasal type-1 receptor 4-like n=1 Tax=Marmota flaviventris TaxID=93162 RepID=UPI003A871F79